MGGKVRLRKWLIEKFPQNGRIYFEPFAGLGNVFYLSKQQLKFSEWQLNDINPFLKILQNFDVNELPCTVNKDEFSYWKNLNSNCSKIIEPRITFGGKGYSFGYSGSSGNHVGYSRENYQLQVLNAKFLLANCLITTACYKEIDFSKFTSEDFIYFDPPYFGTKASYPNIDHLKLIQMLNSLECKWAISGYENEIYSSLRFLKKFSIQRNSEIKGSSKKAYSGVREILWTNY